MEYHIDGLLQDHSNSSALAMELLQSCTKTSIFSFILQFRGWTHKCMVILWQQWSEGHLIQHHKTHHKQGGVILQTDANDQL